MPPQQQTAKQWEEDQDFMLPLTGVDESLVSWLQRQSRCAWSEEIHDQPGKRELNAGAQNTRANTVQIYVIKIVFLQNQHIFYIIWWNVALEGFP